MFNQILAHWMGRPWLSGPSAHGCTSRGSSEEASPCWVSTQPYRETITSVSRSTGRFARRNRPYLKGIARHPRGALPQHVLREGRPSENIVDLPRTRTWSCWC